MSEAPASSMPPTLRRDESGGHETRSRDRRRTAGALRATLARLSAWACIAAIAALSLIPGVLRPHTLLPGWGEHFIAYAGTGIFLALGYLDLRQRLVACVGLAAASGVFEILQNFIPGRSPNPFDALASVSGLILGLALGAALAAALSRTDRQAAEIDARR